MAGVEVAVFDIAIEYQHGRADVKSPPAINVLKSFFACSLIGVVPIELYKFCISLQNTLLFLGSLTFHGNMLLGLGIMLVANEMSRIAQQFGLDSSVRVNMMKRGSRNHHNSQPDQRVGTVYTIGENLYEYENQTRSCGQYPKDGGGLTGEKSVSQTGRPDWIVSRKAI